MTNTNDPKNHEREKVTLGDETFESLPEVQEGQTGRKTRNEVIEVDQVLVSGEDEKGKVRKPSKVKFFGILAAIVIVLAIFSEAIREMIFKAEDSLLFLPKGGFFSPPIGIILISIGITLTIIAFISLFNRRGKLSKQQKWISILIGIVLVVLGISTFFRFVDFRGNTIVDRTMLTDTSYTYLEVVEVNAYVEPDGEGNSLFYNFRLQKSGSGNPKNYDVKITDKNKNNVKNIDSRISNPVRNNINSSAVNEMVKLEMYTREEALKLFNFEE